MEGPDLNVYPINSRAEAGSLTCTTWVGVQAGGAKLNFRGPQHGPAVQRWKGSAIQSDAPLHGFER